MSQDIPKDSDGMDMPANQDQIAQQEKQLLNKQELKAIQANQIYTAEPSKTDIVYLSLIHI